MDNHTVTAPGAKRASLIVRQGAQAGTTYPLEQGIVIIGREDEVDVPLRDPEMSRRHARISWQAGEYVLEDLGSTNGTFLGGNRLSSPQVLHSGDVIKIGQTVLEFQEEVGEVTPQPSPAPVPVPATDAPQPAAPAAAVPPAAPVPPSVAEPKKKKSSCLLWGCGCIAILVLGLVIAVILIFFLVPLIMPANQMQDFQRMLDDNGIPIQLSMAYLAAWLA